MTFGRRETLDRRAGPRCDVARQAALYYGDDNKRVNGLVRNISRNGANFVVSSALNLPRDAVLQFLNGDEFDCEVVRDVDGVEFGLRFKDVWEFDQSQTGDCVESIRHFTKNQTPRDLYELVEGVGFFGDAELENILKSLVASYDQLVHVCSERILPH